MLPFRAIQHGGRPTCNVAGGRNTVATNKANTRRGRRDQKRATPRQRITVADARFWSNRRRRRHNRRCRRRHRSFSHGVGRPRLPAMHYDV